MADDKQHIADVLRTAIKGEEDGFRFYNLLAEKATNADAKRKLEGLRNDEVRHKKTLYGLYEKYVGGEVGELPEKGFAALSDVFRKGRAGELKSEMEFIALAIEAELAATRYYQEQHNLIADPEFRELFDRLAEEEDSHFQLLQAEKQALTGHYSWFSYGEGAPLED